MLPTTPHLRNSDQLGPLASRYIQVDELPWADTKYAGVQVKVLMEDKASGLMTALFKFAPGAYLPLHEHADIEQSFMLEGSLVDHEGAATAGNYVWRPKGNRHDACSPDGALILSMFLKPNIFLESRKTAEGAP